MDTVPLRHTQAANQAPSALLGLQPRRRHLTTQGPRQVSINVGPHRGFMGPARCPGGVSTQATRHRTEHTGPAPSSNGPRTCSRRRPFPMPGRGLPWRSGRSRVGSFTNTGPTTRPALPPTASRMKVPAPFAPFDNGRVVEARQRVRGQGRGLWGLVEFGCQGPALPTPNRHKGSEGIMVQILWAGRVANVDPPQVAPPCKENQQPAKEDEPPRTSHVRPAGQLQGDPARPSRHTRGPKTWGRVQGTEGGPAAATRRGQRGTFGPEHLWLRDVTYKAGRPDWDAAPPARTTPRHKWRFPKMEVP